jgi:hypothetical protein
MQFLIKNRKLTDIYDLLENERKRATIVFEKEFEMGNLEPIVYFKISVENTGNVIYKESQVFTYENINLTLANRYDPTGDVYYVALKIVDIGQEENQTQPDSQFIISILSIFEIKEIGFKTKINFNSFSSSNRSRILLCKIENFSTLFPNFDGNIEYSQAIYFKISYKFSAIFTHICNNFYEYHSLTSISKLSKNVVNIILKNEALKTRSDDDVLYSVITWINNKKHINLEQAEELFQNVKWDKISLDGLLDFILNESKILIGSRELQDIAINEFKRRFRDEFQQG